MAKILISVADIRLTAELNDSETARAIYDHLPLQGPANVWGEEIYFSIPLELDEAADARAAVDVGELAYWPAGSAFCIFFGPTPVSTDDRPRAYSPVNVFGSISENPAALKQVPDGEKIRVTKADG